MSYICQDCGTSFPTPAIDHSSFAHAFGVQRDDAEVCPHCGSINFAEAYFCKNPDCSEYRRYQDELCPGCRTKLQQRFSEFLLSLSDAELDTLNDWIDGSDLNTLKKRAPTF